MSTIAWSLTTTVTFIAIIIWGSTLNWDIDNLSTYTIFPLLGLLAFSVMWSQYVAGAIRRYFGLDRTLLASYSNLTGTVVTTAILLHPGLLIWQLWRDGAGLPPGSYNQYVMPSLKWAVMLGTISLLVFLAFELRHRYNQRSWWRYIDYANDVAIVAIYLHAFKLGSHIGLSWFYPIWIFYGLTLAAVLAYKYLVPTKNPA